MSGTVTLQVEGDALCFVAPGASDPAACERIPAGSIAAVRRAIRHEPLRAAELEAAIEAVEDLIMPALRRLPPADTLAVAGPELSEAMAALLPAARNQSVTIDAVEDLFNRLADVASGSPLGRLGVPYGASFALGLILLREVMHHGGYRRVCAASEQG